MSKWFGVIGYAVTEETEPGVWTSAIKEVEYYGDLVRNNRRLQSSDKVNDDITISNELSIVADPYAMNNFHTICYASFGNGLWKVTNVEVQYPRLILSLGGVYNGDTPSASSDSM